MANKYFKYPFATAGDKTAIPETTQPDGTMSYQEGFSVDYQDDYPDDANAKAIPRDETNQLFFDMTNTLKQYQEFGVPDFISSSDNLGTPFPYAINAMVRYTNNIYISLADANVALPTDDTQWRLLDLGEFLDADEIAALYYNKTQSDARFLPIGDGATFATKVGLQNQSYTYGVTTGSVNAYAFSPTPAITGSYTVGQRFSITNATGANTGASTLNVSALGAVNILKYSGTGFISLETGDWPAGYPGDFEYVGSNFIMINPAPKTSGSFANPGYSILPNGLILQWGTILGFGPVTLPLTFPNAALNAQGTSQTTLPVGVQIVSNSSITIQVSSGAVDTYWFVIGY